MAYDEMLQERIRRTVGGRVGVTEKKMFGGVAFLLDGKMFCGIVKDDLMVRVGPDRHEDALREPHVRPMDFTGRPMKGYVYVDPDGSGTDREVKRWAERGFEFVSTLEGKAKPVRKKARSK
ncbi:TfoX/Sxy family protein [Edaphobacter aggregans]|uniref:TfoX/Sxy family protein n=1 Tax=Edaphobacter aggregans TaxID=570835 RepID=UPI00055392DC|nr:TfoX/Sxy family protein [Edaphobacter aggregans]